MERVSVESEGLRRRDAALTSAIGSAGRVGGVTLHQSRAHVSLLSQT